jgi:hypothetical protein
MATQKQILANRKNALNSTGPRTETGKRIASRNAIRHGFYSTEVLLPREDEEEFLRQARRLVAQYNPCGPLEEAEVRTAIETRWRLRRTNLVESELYQSYGFYEKEQRGVGTAFAQDATQGNAFSKLARYQSHLSRTLRTAEAELRRLQAVRGNDGERVRSARSVNPPVVNLEPNRPAPMMLPEVKVDDVMSLDDLPEPILDDQTADRCLPSEPVAANL